MTFPAIRIVDLHHNNETIEVDELTNTGAEMLIYKALVHSIQEALKKYGYEEMMDRQSDEYINDLCEANGYLFTDAGHFAPDEVQP